MRPDPSAGDGGANEASALVRMWAGKEVVVELSPSGEAPRTTSGKSLKGTLAHLDGTSFVLWETPQKADRLRFEDTRSVSFNDRSRGAKDGALIGAGAGGVAGLVLGSYAGQMACQGEDSNGQSPSCRPGAAMATWALAGALLVGFVGLLVGAGVGHQETMTF